jgi:hypothetical protein
MAFDVKTIGKKIIGRKAPPPVNPPQPSVAPKTECLGWRIATFAVQTLRPTPGTKTPSAHIWRAYLAWCREGKRVPLAMNVFFKRFDVFAQEAGIGRFQNGAHVLYCPITSINDLHLTVERRNEHLKLAQEVEAVILALERATGRTEEVLRREAARQHAQELLAVLDAEKVPDHIADLYPALPRRPEHARGRTQTPVPLPMPARSLDRDALMEILTTAEAELRVADPAAPATAVSLDAQTTKGRGRSMEVRSR